MIYLWWGSAILAVILMILFLLKIRIFIHFLRIPGYKEAYIRFFLFRGLFSYTFYFPFKDDQAPDAVKKGMKEEVTFEEAQHFAQQAKGKLERVEHLHRVTRSFLKKIEIHTFLWRTAIGMKDAAWTGTAAGSLWALKGGILSAAGRMMKITAAPEIDVVPVFGQSIWKVECSCMISFRAGHAIAAVISLFFHRRRRKKHVKTGPAFQKNG
ncbi:DUF2953 domain-containing protein [Bacillus sp. B190/17]|uniref:DUF2953 domain-containing protein n=1 Tax=Bacillus lumedeiriae TaxID=3058829 RepID=A0ABW8I7P0_9BACI